MDASIGELHTATMALTLATLLFAVRFGRDGTRADLLWLTFVFSQGVVHQRSLILIAPAVLLLVLPHLLDVFRMGWRTWLLVIGIALLAPLTYLYLPLRVWMGADWVFGAPGTWDGFWTLFFDNRADRVFDLSTDWAARLRTTLEILHDDLWLPLLGVGLAGLWLAKPGRISRKERQDAKPESSGTWRSLRLGVRHPLLVGLALTLAWLPNFAVTVLIWRNRVTDGQLAAKLPVVLLAGVGVALVLDWLWRMRGKVPGARFQGKSALPWPLAPGTWNLWSRWQPWPWWLPWATACGRRGRSSCPSPATTRRRPSSRRSTAWPPTRRGRRPSLCPGAPTTGR